MSAPLFFIDDDIVKAQTFPSKFYLEEKYLKLTINKIFKYSWQFITDTNQLDKENIFPFKFLKDTFNDPLLLVNNGEKINCLSNVCTHRGSLLCKSKKNLKTIQCKYHGRTFDLNGKIKAAPGFEHSDKFPKNNDHLTHCKVKQWKHFIFSGINPEINLDDIFKDIDNRLGSYPFEKLVYNQSSSNEYILDANWALYCENYLEGFHVPYVHPGLNNDLELKSYKTILLENGVLQFSKSNTSKNSINKDNIYAYYYFIFPNIMFNFYSWGLSINIIEPINKNKTRIRFLSYPIKANKQPFNNESSLDKVEDEDQSIVKRVQEGLNSSFYNRGRYSPENELGVHHFHKMLCNYIS